MRQKLRIGPGAARSSAWQGRQVANLPVMEGNGPTPPKTIGRSPNFQCARSRLHFGARQAIDTIWNLQNRMSSHSKIAATADWAWPSWYFTSCVSPFHSCPFARIGRRTQRDSRLAGWLGHVSLATTNRYAEINLRMKQAALDACQPPISAATETFPRRPIWRDDAELLKWLKSI